MAMDDIAGILLAGGRARRMGREKALIEIAGRALLAHGVARLAPQCARLVVSANGDPARFTAFGIPVVADDVPDCPGPLAGILAGLEFFARNDRAVTHAVSLAADTPFAPHDLVARLAAARRSQNADIAIAASGGRRHYVAALWPVAIRSAIRETLAAGERKVEHFIAASRVDVAEWPVEPYDPFFNVNTPDDLARAETIARTLIPLPCE
jgi:molybdopterin-guanine dinucleotide biosynthesis protein A